MAEQTTVTKDELVARLAQLIACTIYECNEHPGHPMVDPFVFVVSRTCPVPKCFVCGSYMTAVDYPTSENFILWGLG